MIQQLIYLIANTSRSILDAFAEPVIRKPIAISLGAIAGALTRYYLTLWCANRFGINFPYGTFLINLTGCFMMGLFVAIAERLTLINPELRLLIAVGFLGSYTTFSTYELETYNFIRVGNIMSALFYWLSSAIMGFFSLQLGVIVSRLIITK
ncbi:MAG: fluoride efflux transporter CrcB [Microcoleaceae cyanobacterium]